MKREAETFLPKGSLYTVNSHDMHLYTTGEGTDTVVFFSGSGTPSSYTDFYNLQDGLKSYARSVSFDKAGYGWSEETKIPRTIDTIVDEVHELLEQANESASYVLVGHSLASLEVIRYAQKYPDEVKGIILLDGGSPEYYANESVVKSYTFNRISAGLRVTGIIRALGELGALLPITGENIRFESLPRNIRDIDKSMYYNHIGNSSNLSYIQLMNQNAQTVINGGYLNDVPLLIISSHSGGRWSEVQHQLLSWSNESRQESLPNSQHYIHWSNQEEVLQQIIKFLQEIQ